jgi:CRP-like cAMP-binding protein
VSLLERQASRALAEALAGDERVVGFSVCGYAFLDRPVLQARAGRGQSKGFLAVTDQRIILIPVRVRDLVSFWFGQIDAVRSYTDGVFVTVTTDKGVTVEFQLADQEVGRAILNRWAERLQTAAKAFDLTFRTPDFEQRMTEEMAKQLAAALPREAAIREVGLGVYRIVLQWLPDKAVASAGAWAAEEIAARYGAPEDTAGQPRPV